MRDDRGFTLNELLVTVGILVAVCAMGVATFAYAGRQRPDRELPWLAGELLLQPRQAVGVYKCCTNVYSLPTRAYNFDIEFLNPDLLPPKTPMFRDVNTTGFMQVTRR